MKRSGFKQLTYAEALEKAQAKTAKRKAAQCIGQKPKLPQTVDMSTRFARKPPSQAAIAGQKRTQQHQTEMRCTEGQWKDEVRSRDNYTCQFPGIDGAERCTYNHKWIQVHHLNPKSQRRDLILVVTNGICLCSKHHAWVHKYPLKSVPMGLLINRSVELATKEGTLGAY